MSLDPRLITLAKISPKSFANQILKRNESLLERLQLVKNAVGKYSSDIEQIVAANETTFFGCPHCADNMVCINCLWTKSHPDFDKPWKCCYAPFKYKEYEDVLLWDMYHSDMTISVVYKCSSEMINIDRLQILTQEDYDDCEHFLLAHIEWAKLDCWGEDFIEEIKE